MSNKKPTKFYTKNESTYYDTIRSKSETIVDLAKVFTEKINKKEVNAIISKLYEKKSVENLKQFIAQNSVNNFDDFKKIFKSIMDSDFMKICTTHKIVEETDKKIKFNITECIWAEVFKDMNETEIGYCVNCYNDFAMAKIYHPKIRLTRTKTCMQDDDYCDHTYTWED